MVGVVHDETGFRLLRARVREKSRALRRGRQRLQGRFWREGVIGESAAERLESRRLPRRRERLATWAEILRLKRGERRLLDRLESLERNRLPAQTVRLDPRRRLVYQEDVGLEALSATALGDDPAALMMTWSLWMILWYLVLARPGQRRLMKLGVALWALQRSLG